MQEGNRAREDTAGGEPDERKGIRGRRGQESSCQETETKEKPSGMTGIESGSG